MTTLSLSDLLTPATATQWESKILSVCSLLGLATTSWQPGGVTRTLIAVVSQMLAASDAIVSTFAAGGFLDYASSVTTTVPGWLDVLASSVYNVQRTGATYAAGPVTLINSSASSYGPYAVGTYHLAYTSGGVTRTYSNTATLTIAASTSTIGAFAADVAGAASTVAANLLSPVTALVGVTVSGSSPGSLIGADAETNASLVNRCRLKLAALGPYVAPLTAYDYFAISSTETGYPTLTGSPINRTKTLSNPIDGTVVTYLANASGAPPGADVTAIDTWLHARCTPTSVTSSCSAASAVATTFAIHIWIPSTYSSVGTSAIIASINTYIQNFPVGGEPVGVGSSYVLPIQGCIDAAMDAAPYALNATAQLNGTTSDLALSSTEIPVLSAPPTVTLHLV